MNCSWRGWEFLGSLILLWYAKMGCACPLNKVAYSRGMKSSDFTSEEKMRILAEYGKAREKKNGLEFLKLKKLSPSMVNRWKQSLAGGGFLPTEEQGEEKRTKRGRPRRKVGRPRKDRSAVSPSSLAQQVTSLVEENAKLRSVVRKLLQVIDSVPSIRAL